MDGINKTTKYFFVPFSEESSSFISNYNICYKNDGVRIYLDDLEKKDDYGKDTLFVCFDRNKILRFEEKLTLFKFTDNYIIDYPLSESKHIIVFKISKKYRKTFDFFYNGEYSKMYDNKIIENCFKNHSNYFLKYKSIPITMDNIKIFNIKNNDTVLLETNFQNIILSPYHVLKKSKQLTEILSVIYNVDKNYFYELDSKIDLFQEILRNKKI